jgi:hypothetical protein
MAMKDFSDNAGGPEADPDGIYRLDAVRLLIHGRADEST